MRFLINRPGVVHEMFEDEMVLVNLDTGKYYSLTPTAADIWKGIDAGASVNEIVDWVSTRVDGVRTEIESSISEFVGRLEAEALIVPAPADAPATAPVSFPSTKADDSSASRSPFVPPALQSYTDMQDLLLLDPIHEVDDSGWPNKKPTSEPQ